MKLSDRFLKRRGLDHLDEFYEALCSSTFNLHPKTSYPKKKNWWPGDLEEAYKLTSDYHRQHWDPLLAERPIEYSVNKYGMRMEGEPFECPDSILFLGCSFTFGLGRYKEESWPEIAMKETGMQGFNISCPSASLDTCYRLLNQWLPVTKSKTVMVLIPPGTRYEMCHKKDVDYYGEHEACFSSYGAWTLSAYVREGERKLEVAKFLSMALFQEIYQKVNMEKNLAAMAHVCQENGARLIVKDHLCIDQQDYQHLHNRKEIEYKKAHFTATEEELEWLRYNWEYSARDGYHPTRGWQELCAKVFIEEMNDGTENKIP